MLCNMHFPQSVRSSRSSEQLPSAPPLFASPGGIFSPLRATAWSGGRKQVRDKFCFIKIKQRVQRALMHNMDMWLNNIIHSNYIDYTVCFHRFLNVNTYVVGIWSAFSSPGGGAQTLSFPRSTTSYELTGLQPQTDYIITLYTLFEGREEATPVSTTSRGRSLVESYTVNEC